ncbi:MAG: RidA family protein [Acidobacteriota bacterium]
MTDHQIIHTDSAPAAIGPYSQATVLPVGDRSLIFVAGQIPIDPATGALVSGPIEVQVRQALENIRAILQAADSDLDRVTKTTIFLADMNTFEACNAVYAEYFSSEPPARATIEASRLPKGVAVEIEVVAYR